MSEMAVEHLIFGENYDRRTYLSEQETADMLGLAIKTLRNRRYYAKHGSRRGGPSYLSAGRVIRYRRVDVQEYMSRIEKGGVSA